MIGFDKKAHNMRTASTERLRGQRIQRKTVTVVLNVASGCREQDQRSQQDPTKGERGAVLVTVMYEADTKATHALYVSIRC